MRKSVLLGWVLLMVAARDGVADELTRRAACRLSFGNTVRQRASFITGQSWLCHHARLLGKIPATIDCSDNSTWAASGYSIGVEALARGLDRLRAQAAECTVPTTAEVGYSSCPAPCAALPTSTFPELGECMECVTQAAALTTFQTTLGMPPPSVSRDAHNCHQNIARGSLIYLNKRMKMQHDCKILQEIGKPEFAGVDCADVNQPTHPYNARALRAVDKITRQISRRCAAVALATELDTCGSDTTTEIACVMGAVNQWTDTLMTALYPPF